MVSKGVYSDEYIFFLCSLTLIYLTFLSEILTAIKGKKNGLTKGKRCRD